MRLLLENNYHHQSTLTKIRTTISNYFNNQVVLSIREKYYQKS